MIPAYYSYYYCCCCFYSPSIDTAGSPACPVDAADAAGAAIHLLYGEREREKENVSMCLFFVFFVTRQHTLTQSQHLNSSIRCIHSIIRTCERSRSINRVAAGAAKAIIISITGGDYRLLYQQQQQPIRIIITPITAADGQHNRQQSQE